MQTGDGRLRRIHSILRNVRSPQALKELFWTELNYNRSNRLLSRRNWTERQAAVLADDPVLFATAGDGEAFQVIYARLDSDKLNLSPERLVVSRMLKDHPYALFIFANQSEDRFHLLNVKEAAVQQTAGGRKAPSLIRRITLGPEEKLWTATQRIAMLDVAAAEQTLFGVGPLEIQKQHDEAFDVEAVTKQFFEDYQTAFKALQDDLKKQTRDAEWAHDYALQFLNRLMFLYFVQRKRWLGDDSDFLRSFWEAYQDSKQPRDSFFSKWLSVLFFEAFNNCYSGGHRHFPQHVHEALLLAPYLNGGLFKRNALDSGPGKDFAISDARFKAVFDFLEQYNFTITEDSPVDQEVAVDPEMIGKVYESLVNVSSEADERGDAGIFYTPRTEIDLMCRLALVDNLANHLGQQHKNLLYELVFALEPEDKETADSHVADAELWDRLNHRLQETTVVDPACGSGSFLVGMLHILDDLQTRAARRLRVQEDSYDRKKRIIGQSLYGVDVMEWACHVAELRLWLALIIDADIDTTAAHIRKEPLLPHFSFKIRCGDSLVQEVGHVNMAHIKGSELVPPPVKRKITLHKERKLQFYNNDDDREYKTEQQVKEAELRLFREILDGQDTVIGQQIAQLNQRINNPKARQIRLDGSVDASPQLDLEATQLQRRIEELEAQRERLSDARRALQSVHDVPFVWDIAFVEIFEADGQGFDIVVGNPPYVRQEKIADPRLGREAATAENKREYKAKLARSVHQTYPKFFQYDPGRDVAGRRLDAKSDLYIYFYFLSLSLLNAKGSFSFITSNSWLDGGYGSQLQEFLLRCCHGKLVLDNEVRRVFESADVNPVIVLFAAPSEGREPDCDPIARFVMFTVPFEGVRDPVIFEEIEEWVGRKTTPDYRLFAATQRSLLEAGCPAASDGDVEGASRMKRARSALLKLTDYEGDKWGGKYLKAPDIFWRIMEKGSGKLTRLGDVAEVRFGLKTGANDFFYFDSVEPAGRGISRVVSEGGWEGEIENRYLRRVIRSPRECYSVRIPDDCGGTAFWCQEPKSKLQGTGALAYIRYGERKGYDEVPSVSGRANWYSLPQQLRADLFWPRAFFERFMTYLAPNEGFASDRFFVIAANGSEAISMWMNTLVAYLCVELWGLQVNHGGIDTKVVLIEDLPVFADMKIDRSLRGMFKAITNREIELVSDEILREDRREFDYAVLSQLGLSETDVAELHRFVAASARGRILKARRRPTEARRGDAPLQDVG